MAERKRCHPALGSGLNSSPPYDDCGKRDGCSEIAGQLVIAGCDPAPILQMTEGPLDEVALLVEDCIKIWDVRTCRIGFDHSDTASLCEKAPQPVTVVGGVAEDAVSPRLACEQRFRGADVAALTRGQREADQPSGAICDGMDFRCPATTAAADGLRLGPPFPPALQR